MQRRIREFFSWGPPPLQWKLEGPFGIACETFSGAFGNKLVELAGKDDKVVVITAAMPESTGLIKFQERYPTAFLMLE